MVKELQIKQEFMELYSELDLGNLLNKLAARICDYLYCQEAAIFLYDKEKEHLSFEIATGEKQDALKQIVLKKGEGIVGWVASNVECAIVNDCASDSRFTAITDKKTLFTTQSVVAVPVIRDGVLLGVLEGINKKDGDFGNHDQKMLESIASLIYIPLQNAMLVREVLEKERLEKEIQIAREIQQSFLLNEPVPLPRLDAAFINLPSSAVGGDYYDIVKLGEDEAIFTINDISGHGIPASLLMSIFRANFTYRIKKDNDMLKTIGHLNDLIAETTDTNMFVTSFTCHIDTRTLLCRYINAGHCAPLVFRNGEVFGMDEASMVIGLFDEIPRMEAEVQLKPGDVIFLYTDGVYEAENAAGDQFSMEGIHRTVNHLISRGLDSHTTMEDFVAVLKEFTGKDYFDDDITIIIIKVLTE